MAQEYRCKLTIAGGDYFERLAFCRDAFARQSNWQWGSIGINPNFGTFEDDGTSHLEFHTRNFPNGLQELMAKHPAILLKLTILDLSSLRRMRFVLCDNREYFSREVGLDYETMAEVDREATEAAHEAHFEELRTRFAKPDSQS